MGLTFISARLIGCCLDFRFFAVVFLFSGLRRGLPKIPEDSRPRPVRILCSFHAADTQHSFASCKATIPLRDLSLSLQPRR